MAEPAALETAREKQRKSNSGSGAREKQNKRKGTARANKLQEPKLMQHQVSESRSKTRGKYNRESIGKAKATGTGKCKARDTNKAIANNNSKT